MAALEDDDSDDDGSELMANNGRFVLHRGGIACNNANAEDDDDDTKPKEFSECTCRENCSNCSSSMEYRTGPRPGSRRRIGWTCVILRTTLAS